MAFRHTNKHLKKKKGQLQRVDDGNENHTVDEKAQKLPTSAETIAPIDQTPQRFRLNFPKFFSRKRTGIIAGLIVLSCITTTIVGVIALADLPSPKKLKDQTFPVSSKIYDRNGELLYELYADKNRTPITLSDLPSHVYQASIAIEDQKFYSHFGFDIEGIIRAARNTIFKQKLQGGSTITQQLVKTTLLTNKRTLTRKAREAVLTVATEILYSKNDILEMYVNHIPYGGTAYGIEAAARTFFDKSAKDLSIGEAALLAGLPQAPSTYSPFGSRPELAKNRQQQVLRRMVEDGYITQEQADTASNEELKFAINKIDIKAPHFVFYVKDLLEEKYPDIDLERAGWRITTTLDLSIQNQAQASVSAEIDKLKRYKVGNGAALVTRPRTGEILAMVGSRDYFEASADGQVNVTTRQRQPGSSIKPLNFATAIELGKITPGTMLLDIPTCFQVDGQPLYCPKNYDGSFKGPIQIRFALGNSLNIPSVKTLALNGMESFIATASAMGITTWKDPSRYGLSLTLGGGEVTMLDLATAYGTLANQGVRINLDPIVRIQDYTGKTIQQRDIEEIQTLVDELTEENATPSGIFDRSKPVERVLKRATAYLISHILLDNNARSGAFGPSSQLVIPKQVVSVKTGTTNDLRDNWTVGYTPEILTAVWVGNNDNSPMNRALVSGITGAAPIWNDIMSFLLAGKKEVWPEKPDDVVSGNICTTSGLLPDPANPCSTRAEFFTSGSEPTQIDTSLKDTWIVPTTGLPPKEGDPQEGLVLEKHLLLTDPFTSDYCVDCKRAVDEKGSTIYERYVVPFGKRRIDRNS